MACALRAACGRPNSLRANWSNLAASNLHPLPKKRAPDGTLLFLAVQRVMCEPCSVDSLAIFRIPGAICSCPFGDIAGNLAARRPLRRAPVPNTPARRMTPIIGSIRRQGSYFGCTVRLCDPIVGSSRLKVPRVPRPLSLMLTASRFPGKSI